MKVVALAGGVGGAKLVDGLAGVLPPEDLSVIVNTGDDFEHLGLTICPDLDTVTYTLAGLANPDTGWGRRDESWSFLDALRTLGGPTWFKIGDRDLALHIERTRRLRAGEPLSAVTRTLCEHLGVSTHVLPMTDQPVRTRVLTDGGELGFQQYFVERACEPAVRGFRFEGADQAAPAPGVLEVLRAADLVMFCPSNPWVSLDPILSISGIRTAIEAKPSIGVSPIVGGKAIRGPAAKMFGELGIEPTALAVAEHFRGLLGALVIDLSDTQLAEPIARLGIRPFVAQTVMLDRSARIALARRVLECAAELEPVA
ncbi:MAG TPA: 2-phospho-L-lactate transferase [Anaerolineales bacterium]